MIILLPGSLAPTPVVQGLFCSHNIKCAVASILFSPASPFGVWNEIFCTVLSNQKALTILYTANLSLHQCNKDKLRCIYFYTAILRQLFFFLWKYRLTDRALCDFADRQACRCKSWWWTPRRFSLFSISEFLNECLWSTRTKSKSPDKDSCQRASCDLQRCHFPSGSEYRAQTMTEIKLQFVFRLQ